MSLGSVALISVEPVEARDPEGSVFISVFSPDPDVPEGGKEDVADAVGKI